MTMIKYNPIENRILAPEEESPDNMVYITDADAALIMSARPDQRIIIAGGVVMLETLPANTVN